MAEQRVTVLQFPSQPARDDDVKREQPAKIVSLRSDSAGGVDVITQAELEQIANMTWREDFRAKEKIRERLHNGAEVEPGPRIAFLYHGISRDKKGHPRAITYDLRLRDRRNYRKSS